MAPSNGNDKKRRKLTLGDWLTYIIGTLFFLFVFYMLTVRWHG